MPRKIRERLKDLSDAGFYEITGGGRDVNESDLFHKWVEWSEQDGAYIGQCPDLISGIHGDDPVRLYAELCDVINDVIRHFKSEGRRLPTPTVRPMRELV